MGFLCLTKVLPTGTLVLTLFASLWLGTAQANAQIEVPTTEPRIQILPVPSTDPPATQSIPKEAQEKEPTQPEATTQPDDKSEPATESKPEPEPDPPTEEEKELVKRLLIEANADVYKTRRSAQRQLIKLGARLPIILAEVGPPTSLEAKAAVNKALHRLDEGRFTLVGWQLTVWPKQGESLDLGPSTIEFYKDGSFLQSGQSGRDPETWQFDRTTQELTLSLNGGYAIYTGTEDENGNFVGNAKNIKKKQWHFKLAPMSSQIADSPRGSAGKAGGQPGTSKKTRP